MALAAQVPGSNNSYLSTKQGKSLFEKLIARSSFSHETKCFFGSSTTQILVANILQRIPVQQHRITICGLYSSIFEAFDILRKANPAKTQANFSLELDACIYSKEELAGVKKALYLLDSNGANCPYGFGILDVSEDFQNKKLIIRPARKSSINSLKCIIRNLDYEIRRSFERAN